MKITVDGEVFDVVESQPGVYSFTWLTGPNPGYGFHSSSSDESSMGSAAIEAAIRGFLVQVDPETGFIE